MEISADPELIDRALNCLVDNPIKYSDPDSLVYINIARENGITTFGVKDTGKGFTEITMTIFSNHFNWAKIIMIKMLDLV